MIDRSHEAFNPPLPEQIIWRYMDLARFMSILQTSSIWLSRLDLLGDSHEGAYGQANLVARQAYFEQTGVRMDFDRSALRSWNYVNCWHMNLPESAAMWGLYQQEGRGIAIRTSVGRLDSALQNVPAVLPLFLGQVEYIDYTTALIPESNVLSAVVHKRLSFEHEREVRLVAMRTPDTFPHPEDPEQEIEDPEWVQPAGIGVKVDLEQLVEAVYLAPGTPSWFGDVVRNSVRGAQLTSVVHQSSLDDAPLY